MKNTNKKGFTLVELLVVIAIVAILATVAIVGYTSFTNKANVSNDKTLVAQLNTAVTKADGKYTIHEAAELLRDHGFDISKIEATAKNNEILWDNTKGEFFYTEDGAREGDIWIIVSEESKIGNTYNNYYVGTENIEALDVTKQIFVYTEGEAVLSINAPLAHVEHYGEAKEINVIAVSNTTYVEKGTVNKITIKQGRLLVTAAAEVVSVVVDKATEVKLETGSTVSAVIVNDAAVKVEVETGANVDAIAPGNDAAKETIKNNVVGTGAAAVADKVVEEVVEVPVAGDFAGGLGTEKTPYLIETPAQLANISNYYEAGYKYFKVADGITSLDLTGIGEIQLYGSFDGNGVVIKNLTTRLFGTVKGNELATVKNFDIVGCDIEGAYVAAVCNNVLADHVVFENINVGGFIQGSGWAAPFISYAGNYGKAMTLTFKNCYSNATLVATNGGCAGFIGHPGNIGSYKDSRIEIIDSKFEGTMSQTSGYFYYVANNYITEPVVYFNYSENYNVEGLYTLAAQLGAADEDGFMHYNSTANNGTAGIHYAKPGCTAKFVTQTLTAPDKYAAYELDALEGTTHATIEWTIGFDGVNGGHNWTGVYMSETVNVADGKITSDSIKNYDVALNAQGVKTTGLVGNTFNVVNAKYTGEAVTSTVVITEYNDNGTVLRVTTFNLK